MSSSSSSSSSSAAAATVTVTARDIEFSNYNSSTGKWGNAVLTMMIEDTDTPDNLNLEVYNEKVYAVFRNHDDPTDVIQTSAEVDGMDFRVAISTPMVASGKYELYKIYGETSHAEYATSSQFYIQVPGKVWDFANDTVEEDVELVSDWNNYGYIKDVNDNIYGITSLSEMKDAVISQNDATEFSVNGTTLTRQQVKGFKMTSMVDTDLRASNSQNPNFLRGYDNLEELDIVSSKVTVLMRSYNDNFNYANSTSTYYSCYGLSSRNFNQKFAYPSTLNYAILETNTPVSGSAQFNKPVYLGDNITIANNMLYGHNNKTIFNSKIRFSPNLSKIVGGFFGSCSNLHLDTVYPLSNNVQLYDISDYWGALGYAHIHSNFNIPSTWTYIPSNFMKFWSDYDYDINVPEGIIEIRSGAISQLPLSQSTTRTITLPSTLTSCSGLENNGRTMNGVIIDLSKCNNLTSFSSTFNWTGIKEIKWPTERPVRFSSLPNTFGYFGARCFDVDPNTNTTTFEVPEGITRIGNQFFRQAIYWTGDANTVHNIILPSTLTYIDASFNNWWYDSFNAKSRKMCIDMTKIDPDNITIVDNFDYNGTRTGGGFCMDYNDHRNHPGYLTVKVAPGTTEKWKEKLPDVVYEHPSWASNSVFSRIITWVEKPTQYAYVFYETNYYDDTPTNGYVELQSMTDFNKLVNGPNAVSDAAVIVDTDDQGNTIELHFGSSSRSSQGTNINTITGVYVGTDITAIPDHFLRSYRFLKRFKWGGNETSIGSYLAYNAGRYLKTGDTTVSYDLANIPDTVTTIGTDFFNNAGYLNEEVNIPSSVTTIQNNFMAYCTSFNQPITFPDGITELNYILSGCTSFNQTVTLPNTLTKLSGFLIGCTSYTLPVTLPNTLTELYYFMTNCTSFNQPITFPNTITRMVTVLWGCTNYTQPITLSSSLESLVDFLTRCVNYNQTITLPSTIKSCDMLEGCTSYNQPLDLPKNCSYGGVLKNATSFNSVITFVNGGGETGRKNINNFLSGCTSFNQPIDLSPLTNIWQTQWCMEGCTAFNSSITFPSAIGSSFGWLNDCTSFNQPLVLPTSVGSNGMYGDIFRNLKSFNQPITIPANWTTARWYNGSSLFKNCESLTSTVTIEANAPDGSDARVLQYSFTTTDSSAPCYTTGVTFTGTKAQDWKNVLPDYDGSQATPADTYRKINLV